MLKECIQNPKYRLEMDLSEVELIEKALGWFYHSFKDSNLAPYKAEAVQAKDLYNQMVSRA